MRLFMMYPVYCIMYMLFPNTTFGGYIKNPFVKFVCHSASYIFFLILLTLASQRIEYIIVEALAEMLDASELSDLVIEWERKERGALPSVVEWAIILWVVCLLWRDIKSVCKDGLVEYMSDLWSLADWFTNFCFIGRIHLLASDWLDLDL